MYTKPQNQSFIVIDENIAAIYGERNAYNSSSDTLIQSAPYCFHSESLRSELLKNPCRRDRIIVVCIRHVKGQGISTLRRRANSIAIIAPIRSNMAVTIVQVIDLIIETRIFL